MKSHIQALLKRIGIYERIQNSPLYDAYWRIADSNILEKRSNEVKFYRNLLSEFQRGDLIFDVGANHGTKTDIFLRLGAKVVAVEPDESNQEVLRRAFLRYRVITKPVTVVGKALSDRNATETMWIDSPGSALNTLSEKWVHALTCDGRRFGHKLEFAKKRRVETTTLEDLFGIHGVPLFIKIDVEGFELKVLRGLKRPVPFLSFEVNLPEFKSDGMECVSILAGLAEGGQFNYAVDCQHGLKLKRWLEVEQFKRLFTECNEGAVEIFWKTRT